MNVITDWMTAIGTVGAVVVALYLARNAGRESRRREARHQAEMVTAWLAPNDVVEQDSPHKFYAGLHIRNASDLLIYDLIAQVVSVQGSFRHTAVGESPERNMEFGACIGNVPPGETKTRINTGGGGMHKRFVVEIAFRDAAGRHWLRQGNGILKQIDKSPVELYGLPLPLGWEQ